jgi:hypothetical protein
MAAGLEPGPVEVAFDAKDQRVDLPIGANLPAADEPALVERVVRSGERIGPRRIGKAGADIAAHVKARPIVDRRHIGNRRHRRRGARPWEIGRLSRTNANHCAGGKRNAAHECT